MGGENETTPNKDSEGMLHPYDKNPFYWQYRGEPVVLIGGSDDDNLFQWAGNRERLLKHLDLLVSVGGNYVRNTMSSRNTAHPYNDDGMAYPFEMTGTGKYNLNNWNDAYWQRLEFFLEATQERGIVVQLELWDAYTIVGDGWERQPWNPNNNINYAYAETKLIPHGDPVYGDTSMTATPDYPPPFFCSVPALNNDKVLLYYQTRYIKKMLDVCLTFENILYQIDNETIFPFEVSDFWASFVHVTAGRKQVQVCDSRRFRQPSPAGVFTDFSTMRNPEHLHPISHPEMYTYADIAQNGGNEGQTHYDNLVWFRHQLLPRPRPINHVKTYQFTWPTGVDWQFRTKGSEVEGARRFWRSVFGGAAAIRHHRYVGGNGRGGLGLTPYGQTQIRSMRMLLDRIHVFSMSPRNDLLGQRDSNEAFLLAEEGRQYAVYFTGDGDRSVTLELGLRDQSMTEQWLDVEHCTWTKIKIRKRGKSATLDSPGYGQWVAVLLQTKQ